MKVERGNAFKMEKPVAAAEGAVGGH